MYYSLFKVTGRQPWLHSNEKNIRFQSLEMFAGSDGAKVASTFEDFTTVLTFINMLLISHLRTDTSFTTLMIVLYTSVIQTFQM